MALIKCSECGKEISDKASSCIHCGCPIEITDDMDNSVLEKQEDTLDDNSNLVLDETIINTNTTEENKKKSKRGIVVAVLVVLALIGFSIISKVYSEEKRDNRDDSQADATYTLKKEIDPEYLDMMLASMGTEYDDFEGVSFHYSMKMMHKSVDGTLTKHPIDGMYLYLVRKGNTITPRVVFLYRGDDWIFFDTVKINVAGTIYEIPLDTSDIKRDTVSGGSVVERCDMVATQEILDIAEAIASNSDSTIRLQGDKSITIDLNDAERPYVQRDMVMEVLGKYHRILKKDE